MTIALRRWTQDDGTLVAEGAGDAYVAKIEQLERADALEVRVADRSAWVVELDGAPRAGDGPSSATGSSQAHAGEASRRTLEGAGFAREGLLRGYLAYPGEPRGDVYLYALLRES